MTALLGQQLRQVRKIKGLSLKAVAEPAEISPAYLQKLEAGDVMQPSPNVLHRLAEVLDLSYSVLMELAGYVVPGRDAVMASSTVDSVLGSADLDEDERKAVIAFITHLREQRS